MTFGSTFGRVFSPSFQPKSQAVASSASTWWDLNGTITSCVAAYQPKGAASYAASLANLTGNSDYDATELVSTVDWDASDGWKGDGTNCLNTNLIANPSGETWSFIVRASNLSYSAANAIFGRYYTTSNRLGLVSLTTSLRAENGGITYLDTSKPASGVFALSNVKYYKDGSYVADASGSTPKNTSYLYILARCGAANAIELISTAYVQALAVYNTYISADEISALATAMAAL
jgi:hypothetical protein